MYKQLHYTDLFHYSYNVCISTRKFTSALTNLDFEFLEAKLNFKRLGAEAAAGAIADML